MRKQTVRRPRKLRRLWLAAAIAAVWCVGVTEMWRRYVPLVPSCKTAVGDYNVIGIDRGRVIVSDVNKVKMRRCGPVRIIDPQTGHVVDSFLTADDEILDCLFPSMTRTVVSREGQFFVVDLCTGRDISELKLDFAPFRVSFADDERTLLAHGFYGSASSPSGGVQRRVTTACDVETGRILWSKPDVVPGLFSPSPENATHLLQSLFPRGAPDPAAGPLQRRHRIISLQTGEPLSQFGIVTFDHQETGWLIESPDHRWLAIGGGDSGWAIHETTSGRVAFTLPKINPFAISFSPDSTEFRVRHRVSEYESAACAYARFQVTDGAVLETQAGPIDPGSLESEDGQYGLRFAPNELKPYLIKYNRWLSGIPVLRWFPTVQVQDGSMQLVRHPGDRTIGILPAASYNQQQLHNDSIIVATPFEVIYYALPPRRDWAWLATGILAPLAFVVGVMGIWRLAIPRFCNREK